MADGKAARTPLIAGNWKMNGLAASGLALAQALKERMAAAGDPHFEMLVCPPATLVRAIADELSDSFIGVGGQDCHTAASGAFTGDIAAPMLVDAGATHVILGHSERRQGHGEPDALIAAKARAAQAAGLTTIICIGETEAERDAGQTLTVLSTQLEGSLPRTDADRPPVAAAENTVIAYEPVWAIGTGRTPTLEQVDEAHSHIRAYLGSLSAAAARHIRVLYGGSVKPDNAAELLAVPDVDGALVGGASLDAAGFWTIAMASPKSR